MTPLNFDPFTMRLLKFPHIIETAKLTQCQKIHDAIAFKHAKPKSLSRLIRPVKVAVSVARVGPTLVCPLHPGEDPAA